MMRLTCPSALSLSNASLVRCTSATGVDQLHAMYTPCMDPSIRFPTAQVNRCMRE